MRKIVVAIVFLCLTMSCIAVSANSDIKSDEYINIAIEAGVHYLGFNFPKDVCNDCGTTGVFDYCPKCKSHNITRIRRVSGYLEILDGFTKGKKNEEKNRL